MLMTMLQHSTGNPRRFDFDLLAKRPRCIFRAVRYDARLLRFRPKCGLNLRCNLRNETMLHGLDAEPSCLASARTIGARIVAA